jgi:hypothetical protein
MCGQVNRTYETWHVWPLVLTRTAASRFLFSALANAGRVDTSSSWTLPFSSGMLPARLCDVWGVINRPCSCVSKPLWSTYKLQAPYTSLSKPLWSTTKLQAPYTSLYKSHRWDRHVCLKTQFCVHRFKASPNPNPPGGSSMLAGL